MEKIYGYKEKDVVGLAEFVRNRGGKSLTETFETYALKTGKAKGTVRNLYYALAGKSNKDKSFCDKYLDGKPISVVKIEGFTAFDERNLIKTVLMGKKAGRSVRSVIMEMASGDGKIALRYQNKYRNAIKNKPQLVSEIIAEIKGDQSLLTNEKSLNQAYENKVELANVISKIKSQISDFAEKVCLKEQKENKYLKNRIAFLEQENLRLNHALFGDYGAKSALKSLGNDGGKSFIN